MPLCKAERLLFVCVPLHRTAVPCCWCPRCSSGCSIPVEFTALEQYRSKQDGNSPAATHGHAVTARVAVLPASTPRAYRFWREPMTSVLCLYFCTLSTRLRGRKRVRRHRSFAGVNSSLSFQSPCETRRELGGCSEFVQPKRVFSEEDARDVHRCG